MKILDIEKLRRIKPADFDLTCSVAHRHGPEHVMVCTWGGSDIVRIEVNFARKTTGLYVAGELNDVYENLTTDEFVRLQCVCQMTFDAIGFAAKRKQNGTV